MKDKKILLVGCGKMGGALLGGMLKAGIAKKNILVIEPSASNDYGVKSIAQFSKKDVEKFAADVIIFAVKPQIIGDIISDYKIFAGKALFISIIAGKTTGFFEKNLGKKAAFIRTMPNLPVLVGKGVTVLYKNANVSAGQYKFASGLFGSVGAVETTTDEALLDAVTAISGSGPAYIFHFIECLTQAGIKLGLPKKMAATLAAQTVSGSAELASISDKTPARLREAVTSPKGTTEAALKILMGADKMQKLINSATMAACKRSKELSE